MLSMALLRKVGSEHEFGGEGVGASDPVQPEEQNHYRRRQGDLALCNHGS